MTPPREPDTERLASIITGRSFDGRPPTARDLLIADAEELALPGEAWDEFADRADEVAGSGITSPRGFLAHLRRDTQARRAHPPRPHAHAGALGLWQIPSTPLPRSNLDPVANAMAYLRERYPNLARPPDHGPTRR